MQWLCNRVRRRGGYILRNEPPLRCVAVMKDAVRHRIRPFYEAVMNGRAVAAVALFLAMICVWSVPVLAEPRAVVSITPKGVAELKGANQCPVIITIMASRCGACRQELPSYQKMHERYSDQGLAINVVSIDFGGPREIQNIVDRLGLTFPVYWGGEAVMYAYDISLVPYKIVVVNGRIVERVVGAWTAAEIETKISEFTDRCGR